MKAAKFLFLAAIALCCALSVRAHRLDEYLQATRIDIFSNRVDLEIDLTPGVEVAERVLALMNTNHDGLISAGEQDAYARLVLQSVALEVDKQSEEVKLTSVLFPAVGEIRAGTGVIHLRASAEIAPLDSGSHTLYYLNRHATNLSVYLINAYVPRSPAIKITHQERDFFQKEMRIDILKASEEITNQAQADRRPPGAGKSNAN
jgi:hypothetical protein